MIEKIIQNAITKLGIQRDTAYTVIDKYTICINYDGQKPALIGERLIKELETPLAAKDWAIFVEEQDRYFISIIAEKIR